MIDTRAHLAVAAAKRKGILVPEPCLFCDDPNVIAHHHSYAREDWLNVTWLCHRHHVLVHRDERRRGLVRPDRSYDPISPEVLALAAEALALANIDDYLAGAGS